MRRIGKLVELATIDRDIRRCRAFIESAESRLGRERGTNDESLMKEILVTFNASLVVLLRVRSIVRREVREEARWTLD